MIEINQLTKVGDILNSEGMILGLYKSQGGDMFLASRLTDGNGDVYYTTKKDVLIKYFNSEINLREVYISSDDFFVSKKLREETRQYLKNDLVEFIQMGEKFYNTIAIGMKNVNIEKDIISE
jgi:hypothetical protein